MSQIKRLIPAKNALIVWMPKKHQEDFDLKVLFKDGSSLSSKSEVDKWPCSSGCALPVWSKLNQVQMFSECIKILFWEKVTNKDKIKLALFEFGKIQELEEMRALYHALYYSEQMTLEGLENSFYGWDFCKVE